ncbi:Anthocyanidin 3-O-glucosyltransferase, partial [Dichanthelium oligosanthes]
GVAARRRGGFSLQLPRPEAPRGRARHCHRGAATFSFLSTAGSLERLRGAAVPGNLRFVEVPTGGGDGDETPLWHRIKQSLEAARDTAPGAARVSGVVSDAFMSMAADAGVPWVVAWTGGPCALLAHLRGDALHEDIGDEAASRGDELLTSHPGLGCFRVRDLPFGGANPSGDMHRVMGLLLRRMAQRLPRAATAVALNAFPILFPPEVSAALADALPNSLAVGPYHLLPGAAAPAGDPHGCLAWLDRLPDGAVVYVSFGTVATLPPDELRELATGLEATGVPFLWSLREELWPLLPPGFQGRTRAKGSSGLLVPWAPQAAVLRHLAQMNARAVAELWRFGTSFDDDSGPMMTRGRVAATVAALLAGEEGARMRARARELQAKVVEAFQPDGGSMNNFRKFMEIVCAPA